MELLKNQRNILIAAAIVIVVFIASFFLYRPVLTQLGEARVSYNAVEEELSWAKQIISSSQTQEKRKGPVSAKDISLAIDELTKEGKIKGIDFVSITPRQIEHNAPYNILPLAIEVESTYKPLALFLGALDELKKSIITIRKFRITPDDKNPLNLHATVVLNMHLREKKDHGE